MIDQQEHLKSELEAFLRQMPFAEIAATVAAQSGRDEAAITAMLETYANESRATLELVGAYLNPAHRILEIGAGLCLTSLFLKQAGFNITALEPSLGGFGLFDLLKGNILQARRDIQLDVLERPAQELDPATDGSFDLIFSNNVLEHIPDWPAALRAMSSVLQSGGRMLHACPNYTVPYEPHYGILVFRHFPKLSRRLFLGDRDAEIWDSLNFITGHNLRSYCNEHGLNCCFKEELLYSALKRIETDPLFEERHQGLVAGLSRLLLKSGIARLLRHVPPTLATPMIAEISKQAAG